MNHKGKIQVGIVHYSSMLLFFMLTFVYFFRFGDYVMFFQESQSLFVYTCEYIGSFLVRPGGVIVLIGRFLSQFYASTASGAFVLASVLTAIYFLSSILFRRLGSNRALIPVFSLVPACCLLLVQTHYHHFMEINIGYLLVLLFMFLSIRLARKGFDIAVPVLLPFFYYLAGVFAWIFVASYICYLFVFGDKKKKYLHITIIALLPILLVIVAKYFLFGQPINQLISYPLYFVGGMKFQIVAIALFVYIVAVSLLAKFANIKRTVSVYLSGISVAVVFILTVLGLYQYRNQQTATVLQTEKFVAEQKWTDAISLAERKPSGNLIGQYFYNIALSETGQLCDKLFEGQQSFGVNSLILPWGSEHLNFGAYFYYTIGIMNEAHRWAYEDMVVNGQKPANLKLLVKTCLANGDSRMALKYLEILKKTWYYKEWAVNYEKMVADTSLIARDVEFKRQRANMPKGDFFVQINDPQNNIPLLLDSNPGNQRAFEYKTAWLMLSKNIEGVVEQIKMLKTLGYTRIPKHIEEAAMIYYNAKGEWPDLGGLSISGDTRARFDQYVSAFKNNRQSMSIAGERLAPLFGNTFMYYYHFK